MRRKPTLSKEFCLDFAKGLVGEYRERGYLITLRQLYYQGVARGLVPSSQDTYDRLKTVLAKARLRGEFPLDAIVDRTRRVNLGKGTRCDTKVDRAMMRAIDETLLLPERLIHRDRWFGQRTFVSVWFEKEALAGIFQGVCQELGVTWFSCRGDPSHPSLFEWLTLAAQAHGIDNEDGWRGDRGHYTGWEKWRNENNHKGTAYNAVVLYFGDHDPTGMRIPRSAENTIRTFQGHAGLDFPIEFVRVGITLEQARLRNLPPFPAKMSSMDYQKYVAEFGTEDAWELDALDPEELEQMVRDSVAGYFNKEQHARLQRDTERKREEMRRKMARSDWRIAATTWED